MKRDKPFRLNQNERHNKHDTTIANIQDNKAKREPCKPPCDNTGKKGKK